MSSMSKWLKVWRLSQSERLLLAQSAFALPAVAVLIRIKGLRRCQAALARLTPVASPSGPEADGSGEQRARAVARMVGAAAAHGPFRANCLQQSVTLWWLLRRRGLHSDLRIGTRKGDECLEAHAWVEFRGVTLNESRDVHARYTAFEQPVNPSEVRYS
jgi:hypothetical protein